MLSPEIFYDIGCYAGCRYCTATWLSLPFLVPDTDGTCLLGTSRSSMKWTLGSHGHFVQLTCPVLYLRIWSHLDVWTKWKETVSSVSYSYSYTGFASVIFFCWVTSLGREFSTDYCLFSVLFVPFWLSYFFENISTYICRSFWSSQFRQGSEIIHFGVRNIWLIYDEIMLYAWPL